jgi:hypothetical protein
VFLENSLDQLKRMSKSKKTSIPKHKIISGQWQLTSMVKLKGMMQKAIKGIQKQAESNKEF